MQPILKINLTCGSVDLWPIPHDWEQQFLGGASLAARVLYDRLTQDLDPLAPEAPLLFMNGPLTGTAGPAAGRFVICAKSPATWLWGESNCGGFWGPELRMAGYDGLWIEGRAAEPIFLWITSLGVEIRSAAYLWGKDTYQVQAALEAELNAGKVRVASIGLAGENQVPFALVLCDHGRVAGRTGMGAVMGSKNLKAIAVQGNDKVPVANPGRYALLRSEANRRLRSDSLAQMLRELGTAGAAEYFNYLGEMPKRNFNTGTPDEGLKTSGSSLKNSILTGVSACHACVIACGRVVQLEDGKKRKGPEYETLVGFGPHLGLNDPVFATRMGEECDRYGLDSISMSNILGLAYWLYEHNYVSSTDTGGFELIWGNTAPIEPLIHQTARRESFGQLLAQGSRALAAHFNAPDEAIQVNGLEVPFHDPRGASGMALVYATSPRGACHNQSDYAMVDTGKADSSLGMKQHSRHDGADKAADVAIHQNWRTVFNSLVICYLANLPPQTVVDLVNAACNLSLSLEELLLAGERAWNVKRAINNRLGLTRADDKLPKALLQPFLDDPGNAPLAFDTMLAAYYQARGWDPETGFPTCQKLLALDLDWIAQDLWAETCVEETHSQVNYGNNP